MDALYSSFCRKDSRMHFISCLANMMERMETGRTPKTVALMAMAIMMRRRMQLRKVSWE